MKVDFIVSIKHPDDAEPMFLSEEQAKQVYDQLHVKFGAVSFMDRLESIPRQSLGLTPEQRVALLHEVADTGPTLNDDIEAMIAKDGMHTADDADEQEAELLSRLPLSEACQLPPVSKFEPTPCCGSWPWCDCDDPKPSSTIDPPAEPETVPEPKRSARTNETDSEKCVRLWMSYRAKYPKATDSAIVSRVRAHVKRLSNDEVRELLRAAGLAVNDPTPRREVMLNARQVSPRGNLPQARFVRRPPLGYLVVDVEAWNASAPLLSEADIREMAEGGLARCGLAVAA